MKEYSKPMLKPFEDLEFVPVILSDDEKQLLMEMAEHHGIEPGEVARRLVVAGIYKFDANAEAMRVTTINAMVAGTGVVEVGGAQVDIGQMSVDDLRQWATDTLPRTTVLAFGRMALEQHDGAADAEEDDEP